ncbi:hypothetical protein GDO81_008511 [Engystomops pustulosus]|uniref:ZP domain-containing protein n=1 Tax=Engystomops pustulosus TaxID=76066 RepID=A0AAV7CF74_ENGPU|nr:hypothetical protein GDO81_008511 [Engystomops pustulosus]
MMKYFQIFLVIIQASFLVADAVTADSNVEIEINETVICTKDLIEVEIPSSFFLTKTPPIYISDLHLNDPECRGRETGDSFIFSIQTNFTDCGTIMVNYV